MEKKYGKVSQSDMFLRDVPIINYNGMEMTRTLTWGQLVHECEVIATEVPFYEAVSDAVMMRK